MDNDSILTEGLHQHTLARFLRIATEQRASSPEGALAEAMGKAFFPSDVKVRWRAHMADLMEEETGEWLAPRRGRLSGVPVLEVPRLTWVEANPIEDYIFARASTADVEGFKISKVGDSGGRLELEVTFRRVASTLRVEQVGDFRRNSMGTGVLFQSFMALKAARLTVQVPATKWRERLQQTIKDLHRFQAFPGTSHLQERLLEELLDDLFAAGREVKEVAGPEGPESLSRIAFQFGSSPEDSSAKFREFIEVLAASTDAVEATRLPGVAEGRSALGLIAGWTSLHSRARMLLRRPACQEDHASFEVEFLQAVQDCTPALLDLVLSASWETGLEITRLSSWQRLWFCLTLLAEPERLKGRTIEVERLSLYCDLAYIVRESLRGLQEGAPPRFHLPSLSSALAALVEHHATEHLKLPQELNLGGILSEIGQVGQGAGERFATGHLHHVLEMYIGGMFLLETRLTGVEGGGEASIWEGATICQVLASKGGTKPGSDRQLTLRQSFGLGALLHDLGILLFPHWPRRAADLGGRQSGLHGRLLTVRGALNESVQRLLSTCSTELLGDEVFKETTEPAICEWIARCCAEGEADHSVLGAWYLLHHGKRIVSRTVLNKAARAVLFHAIPTQEIHPDEDPAAALLVLCDEVFAWHEGRDLHRRHRTRHENEAAGTEPRAQDSIWRNIRWPGLRLEVDAATGRLIHTLDLSRNGSGERDAGTWPRIELEMKEPEGLPLRVYEHWLLSSQNLRRLRRSANGWSPSLRIRSPPEQAGLETRELLARAGLRASLGLRPYLRRLLALQGEPVRDEGFETIVIGPRAEEPGVGGRIEEHFPELANLVEAVLYEVERRSRTPGSRG